MSVLPIIISAFRPPALQARYPSGVSQGKLGVRPVPKLHTLTLTEESTPSYVVALRGNFLEHPRQSTHVAFTVISARTHYFLKVSPNSFFTMLH